MKIAVCLSGQPRSIQHAAESILHFFTSPEYEVDFFCHAWDYNTWKLKEETTVFFGKYEPVDVAWLESQLVRFNPKKYFISPYSTIFPKYEYLSWGSLFYSMAYANMLKLEYETENNFKYDYVVKSRYDVVFDPDRNFVPAHDMLERHLYFSHAGRMRYRYNYINASDPFFYGDSWGMDIIADSYFCTKAEYLNPHNHRQDQLLFHDPGTFISLMARRFNVMIGVDKFNPCDTIFRKEAMNLNCMTQFSEIQKIHSSYYDNV